MNRLGWRGIIALIIVAIVLAGISGLSTVSATDGCTDVLALVESKGWIYHEAVDNDGHLVELPEDDTLPEGFSAIGDGVTILATDSNRTMKAGWWTVYPTCPEPTPTPITPSPTPEATPIPTLTPVPDHCGAVNKLAEAMGATYEGLTDVMHNGHLITLGDQDAFLPYGYEAVGENSAITMTDSDRTLAAGTTWTVYGKCFGYLPLIEASVYVPPTAVPTATPQGVYCLSTEALAQQLGVDVNRLHMDLFDGFNGQPSGWRLDFAEEYISWTVPVEYVVNHPEGEFTGDGQRKLDFQVGSIWLPWSCRQ